MFFWWKVVFNVTIPSMNPLTLHMEDGTRYRTSTAFRSDAGSIPRIAQSLPGMNPMLFLMSYFFHDDGYQRGGLWIALAGEEEFTFCEMARKGLDDLMHITISAEGGHKLVVWAIYHAVRLGAFISWNRYKRLRGAKNADRKLN